MTHRLFGTAVVVAFTPSPIEPSLRGKMTVKQNALVELRAQTTVDCDTMDLEGKLVLGSVSVKSADGDSSCQGIWTF